MKTPEEIRLRLKECIETIEKFNSWTDPKEDFNHAFQVKEILEWVLESDNDETIEDGFGNAWSKRCPECGKLTMVVVRPGKVQCDNCE